MMQRKNTTRHKAKMGSIKPKFEQLDFNGLTRERKDRCHHFAQEEEQSSQVNLSTLMQKVSRHRSPLDRFFPSHC
jgi:hypothetical protein